MKYFLMKHFLLRYFPSFCQKKKKIKNTFLFLKSMNLALPPARAVCPSKAGINVMLVSWILN